MAANPLRPNRLCIRHTFAGQAIFFGGPKRVVLDAFQPEWMQMAMPANVVTLRRGGTQTRTRNTLRVPMPANDNLAPLPKR